MWVAERISTLWRRGQRGWPADYPVAQFPNAPLLVAIAAWIARRLTEAGSAPNDWATAVFFVSLTAFAWWELADGVNGFRRVMGAAVLAFVIVSLAGELGA